MNEATLGDIHRLVRDTDTEACVIFEHIRQSLARYAVCVGNLKVQVWCVGQPRISDQCQGFASMDSLALLHPNAPRLQMCIDGKSVATQCEYYPISSDGPKVAVWRQNSWLIVGNPIYQGSHGCVCDGEHLLAVTVKIIILKWGMFPIYRSVCTPLTPIRRKPGANYRLIFGRYYESPVESIVPAICCDPITAMQRRRNRKGWTCKDSYCSAFDRLLLRSCVQRQPVRQARSNSPRMRWYPKIQHDVTARSDGMSRELGIRLTCSQDSC